MDARINPRNKAKINPSICVCAVLVVLTEIPLSLCCPSLSAHADERLDPLNDQASFSVTVEDGILFLNGDDLAPPFKIQAFNDRFRVNGQDCLVMSPTVAVEGKNRRLGEGNTIRGTGSGESRRRGAGRESGGRRDRANENTSPHSAATRQARLLTEHLESGRVVVAFDGCPVEIIASADDEQTFFQALLANPRSDDDIAYIVSLAGEHSRREQWRAMAHNLQPSVRTAALMQDRIDEIIATEVTNQRHIDAVSRLDRFAYPLTLVGMLLGVFAFGHMLQWSGKGITASRDNEGASESARCVAVAVSLMFAMSLLDLLWTILAGQAGVMREVNPLAAGYMNSPIQLAAFKVIATGIGLGILYGWRQRQQIQQAAWWMCLVCVLLTFRWIMLDSMMT